MSVWTEELDAAAQKWLAQGLSSARVAQILSREFDTDITRNALIGRAKRCGWTLARPKPARPSFSYGRAAAVDSVAAIDKRQRSTKVKAPLKDVVPLDADPPPGDHPYRQTAAGVEIPPANLCHWPYGDVSTGTLVYCAAPVMRDAEELARPYCAGHWARMVSPRAPKNIEGLAFIGRSGRVMG